jgi:RNA-binding protein YhbY
VQLLRTADVSARDAAQTLAGRVRAEVIQTIGRTATLYRKNPRLKRKEGTKPWA